MENRLELVQKQTLSGQMIQSVMVLQMNMIQLQEHISQIAMENPVIELEEQRREADAEKLRKIEWLAELDEQNRFYYMKDGRAAGSSLKISEERKMLRRRCFWNSFRVAVIRKRKWGSFLILRNVWTAEDTVKFQWKSLAQSCIHQKKRFAGASL